MSVENINAKELRELIKNNGDKLEIIDVREPYEYKDAHIKNSKLIPMGELSSRVDEIDWDKQVVFVCRSGSRSGLMANIISSTGKDIKNLEYGIMECQETGGEFLESL